MAHGGKNFETTTKGQVVHKGGILHSTTEHSPSVVKMRHSDVLIANTTGMQQQGKGMRDGVLTATVPPGMSRAPEFLTHKAPATKLGPSGQVSYADAAHHSSMPQKKGRAKKTLS
jgi:hypothetical protein